MPSAIVPPAGSTSGIITSENGDRHIPSSTRSDGSTRKEIRIRPGYRPPEDIEVYKNRTAEAWKSRGSGGVPGAEAVNGEAGSKNSKANSRNAKRREARKKAKAAEAEDKVLENEEPIAANEAVDVYEDLEVLDDVEKEKRARKLKKKLREARELQERKEKGDGLLQEQFEKVIRINELVRDLDKLGFNANGEPRGE